MVNREKIINKLLEESMFMFFRGDEAELLQSLETLVSALRYDPFGGAGQPTHSEHTKARRGAYEESASMLQDLIDSYKEAKARRGNKHGTEKENND